MQEHIYNAKRGKIISQTWGIWLFVAMQVVGTIAILIKQPENYVAGAVFINIMLGFINIPAILLFLRYYKHSKENTFIVMYNKLRLINNKTGETTELINQEIGKIIMVETQSNNRLPWNSHEYFTMIDSKGNTITVNSYTMSLVDLRLDTLAGRIPADNVEFVKKTYPSFQIPGR